MKRWFVLFMVFAIVISSAGCTEEWRKKFIRKKKDVKKPRIYQLKRYKKEPTELLYNKHYNYAITWLSELVDDLGHNHKKDLRCIEEALSQVRDLQAFLVPEKGKELDKHIARLEEVRDIIKRQDLGQANKDYVMRGIEREERFLRSEFYYNRIKNFMIKSFDEDNEDEGLLRPRETVTIGA